VSRRAPAASIGSGRGRGRERRRGLGGQRGFTLLEVLVALIVLSVAVVAALQLFGGGLRLARAAAEHQSATLLADEKLNESTLETLEEGVTEGTEGDFQWTRSVSFPRDLAPEEPDATRPETVRLARVSVEVRWGRNRHVELATLRAVPVTPTTTTTP
jgi:general secretion pathway protein I